MTNIITLAQVEQKLLPIRGQNVLLDSDVATLYAVKTKEINQAVKNNPDKFPDGYIIQLDKAEWQHLKSKILTSSEDEPITICDQLDEEDSLGSKILTLENPLNIKGKTEPVKNFDRFNLKHSTALPKAFTEKGLYMLATILKGPRAIQTTIAIVETFAKIRELSRTVAQLADTNEKFKQRTLMQKSGDIMADILGEGMKTTDTESTVELNLAVFKFKHTVKRKPK